MLNEYQKKLEKLLDIIFNNCDNPVKKYIDKTDIYYVWNHNSSSNIIQVSPDTLSGGTEELLINGFSTFYSNAHKDFDDAFSEVSYTFIKAYTREFFFDFGPSVVPINMKILVDEIGACLRGTDSAKDIVVKDQIMTSSQQRVSRDLEAMSKDWNFNNVNVQELYY